MKAPSLSYKLVTNEPNVYKAKKRIVPDISHLPRPVILDLAGKLEGKKGRNISKTLDRWLRP